MATLILGRGLQVGEPRLAEAQASSATHVEAALLDRVRARDIRAFEQLYQAHHGRLSRFLGNLLRRPHLVEEVVNDTMMVVWNRIDGFDGRSRFSTWLFGIGYRQGLAALRKLDEPVEDERTEVADEDGRGPDSAVGHERSRRALGEALKELSPAHRAVVELTYYQEFGYREIADIMDCPVDTVKTRMFHARKHLRRALSGELADWI